MVEFLETSPPRVVTSLSSTSSTTYGTVELQWSVAPAPDRARLTGRATLQTTSDSHNRELLIDVLFPRLMLHIEDLAAETRRAAERAIPPIRFPITIPELALSSYPRGIRHPLTGVLQFEEEEEVLEFPELNIVATGPDRTAALDDLKAQIEELASTYLTLSDDELTPGGRDFREALRKLLIE